MATTYKDYYINYNGTRISNNEDTGLTAVNIYYNGTHLGEGAHTLNCAGQYMNGNVTIGARTLNCGGQYMNGNVQVLTQNRYKWYRYYANYVYYEVNNGLRTGSWRPSWEGSPQSVYYGYETTDVLNTSNGVYTISGGKTEYISHRWGLYSARMAYNCTNQDSHIARDVSGSNLIYASRYGEGGPCYISIAGGEVYDMTSAGTWARGSYIDVVQSTNSGAYPSNGTWDGVYWYVAI